MEISHEYNLLKSYTDNKTTYKASEQVTSRSKSKSILTKSQAKDAPRKVALQEHDQLFKVLVKIPHSFRRVRHHSIEAPSDRSQDANSSTE